MISIVKQSKILWYFVLSYWYVHFFLCVPISEDQMRSESFTLHGIRNLEIYSNIFSSYIISFDTYHNLSCRKFEYTEISYHSTLVYFFNGIILAHLDGQEVAITLKVLLTSKYASP